LDKRKPHIPAAVVVLVALLLVPAAWGESGIMNKMGDLFDDVARGLTLFGEKAQDLIGPGLGFGDGKTGGFTSTRDFKETFPVTEAAMVSINNEFGEIRVTASDNHVVEVAARISVRAESADLAAQLCKNVDVHVTNGDKHLEIRTVIPDTRAETGKPAIEVKYEVIIPRNAALAAQNYFGDTLVVGVNGPLSVDGRFGAVGLRDIGGPVNVRSRGEFAVQATGLKQGGTFELHQSRAEFSGIAGDLTVSNFQGTILLQGLEPETEIEAISESGPIYLRLPRDAEPNITATSLFGDIQSDLPLTLSSQGNLTTARSQNLDAKQKITLQSTFSNINVQYLDLETAAKPSIAAPTQPFNDIVTQKDAVPEDTLLKITAMAGDVTVTGIDENNISVKATKLVRVQAPSNARAALQALNVRVERIDKTYTVKTALADTMAALGCSLYRVDLEIECPRTVAIEIEAQLGHTRVGGTGGAVNVRQAEGAISTEHIKGSLDLNNQKGDIEVVSCAGPVVAVASYGNLTLNDIFGKMTATCVQGKTVIEAPHAEIYARSTEGDIKILSLDAVAANYDVLAQKGNISILLPPATDATLSATAENGVVHSSIPLAGSVEKDLQKFIKTNTGPFHVTLQTKNGDIILN
jgi:DUF4097 and DUF4098 domain-containing protein YvlB